VIEPDDNVVAIGSGGTYALAAAQALLQHTDLGAAEVARAAMDIAASICIYTNHEISLLCADGGALTAAGEGGQCV
jgi:ATP-dependent HslUV protease subunit HslV